MNYQERARYAETAKKQLNEGVFPNEVLETIKDKRLRNDLTNLIFSPKDAPKFNDLSESQKSDRARRLKVELSFVRYLASFESMRYSSILLFLFALLTLFFVSIYQNGNLIYGIITFFEAIALFIVSFKNEFIIKYCKLILIVFTISVVIELILFQIPNPFLSGDSQEWFEGNRSVISTLFNQVSPFLYLIGKLVILGFVGIAFDKITKFKESKRIYEGL